MSDSRGSGNRSTGKNQWFQINGSPLRDYLPEPLIDSWRRYSGKSHPALEGLGWPFPFRQYQAAGNFKQLKIKTKESIKEIKFTLWALKRDFIATQKERIRSWRK